MMDNPKSIFPIEVSKDGSYVKIAYKYAFDINIPDWKIENICCFSKTDFGVAKWLHFKRCIELAHPNTYRPNGKSTWTYWTKRMFEEVYNNPEDVSSLMSGGSCGKSEFMAVYGVHWWLYSPETRAVVCASTTVREATQGRIWGKIRAYWSELNRIKEAPGKFAGKHEAIFWNAEIDPSFGLFLKALGNADAQEVFKGFHPKGGLLAILDECDHLDPSITKAIPNMLKSRGKKIVCLANGNNDLYNSFNLISAPLEGFENLDPDTFFKGKEDKDYFWINQYGRTHWFDCYMSPFIKEPHRTELGYLVSEAKIEKGKAQFGEQSANFWSQYRGYPLLNNSQDYVLTIPVVQAGKALQKVTWNGKDKVRKVASLDPAFTAAGDEAILRFGERGVDVYGRQILNLQGEEWVFRILPESRNDEFNLRLVDEVIRLCTLMGVSPENFALDSSGGGGIILAELFRTHWGDGIHAISALGSPSENTIDLSGTKAKDKFSYRFSELCFMTRYFIEAGHIRGLDHPTMEELCKRKYSESGKGSKIRVENKKEYKKRVGKEGDKEGSPDRSDCLGIMLAMEMDRGWVPEVGNQVIIENDNNFLSLFTRNKQEEEGDISGIWDSPDNYAANWWDD